jgi:hypothetical protein
MLIRSRSVPQQPYNTLTMTRATAPVPHGQKYKRRTSCKTCKNVKPLQSLIFFRRARAGKQRDELHRGHACCRVHGRT